MKEEKRDEVGYQHFSDQTTILIFTHEKERCFFFFPHIFSLQFKTTGYLHTDTLLRLFFPFDSCFPFILIEIYNNNYYLSIKIREKIYKRRIKEKK